MEVKDGLFSIEIRKVKYGKHVTVINTNGVSKEKKEEIARTLKRKLGTGGTIKNGEIILQGDQTGRIKVIQSVIHQIMSR